MTLVEKLISLFIQFLLSRKWSSILLLIVAVILIVSSLLPQPDFLTPPERELLKINNPFFYEIALHFNIQRVITSLPFISLLVVIALSLFTCSVKRFLFILRSNKASTLQDEAMNYSFRTSIKQANEAAIIEELLSGCKKRGWVIEKKIISPERRLVFTKGWFGFVGSIIFHFSLLLIVVVVGVGALSRFSAEIALTEGQELSLSRENLLAVYKEPILPLSLPQVTLALSEVTAIYSKGSDPIFYSALLSIKNGGDAVEKTIAVNSPHTYRNFKLLLKRYGYSPRFIISDETDRTILDSFVNLEGLGEGTVDRFSVPNSDLYVEVKFFPDFDLKSSKPYSRSKEAKNPAYYLRVIGGNKMLGRNYIVKGASAEFGGVKIKFADLRKWASFLIVKDPSHFPIIVGMALVLVGIGLRFVDSEKKIWFRLNRNNDEFTLLEWGGRSRYFPALFQEELSSITYKILPKNRTSERKKLS
ncbi:MAG: hypothetical protein Kow0090_07060 [Myxococcota bacterium]